MSSVWNCNEVFELRGFQLNQLTQEKQIWIIIEETFYCDITNLNNLDEMALPDKLENEFGRIVKENQLIRIGSGSNLKSKSIQPKQSDRLHEFLKKYLYLEISFKETN